MLAIETTGPICSVALLAEGGKVYYRASEEGLMHLTSLIPLIEEVLEEAKIKPRKLDQIAVSAGPGSFTGIRIGVATARALAQSLNIPVIKVPTLETFVYMAGDAVACPIFDARRDQMYAGAYMLEEDGRVMTIIRGGAYYPEEYFAMLGASLPAVENLLKRPVICRLMGDGLPVFSEAVIVQDAKATLAWAQAHGKPISYEQLEPIYIRKAEAQRKLEEKNKEPSPWFTRSAGEDDAYGISVIERLSFGEPWLEKSVLDDIKLEYSDYVVCEAEGQILGYAGLHRILDEGHITNIAVHPGMRRKGIGEAALDELIKKAKEKGVTSFTLEVRDSDTAAVAFYEKHGFVTEGARKDYYPVKGGGREDARLMWLRVC